MAIIDKPSDYFNTKLYTGNATNPTTISGIGFQPDWVWTKLRAGGTEGHRLCDAVRGVTKDLFSNDSDGEATNSIGLKSFNSDGYVIGNSNGYNINNGTFVSWNWKAGTTGSGTTTGAGTGKAYSYSVNTTSGFSIVTYLGNGTEDHTIPHHLGVAPKMYIVKQRDGADSWITYHDGLGGADKYILLNTTAVVGTSNNPWGSVVPTSSVNNLGSAGDTNGNDDSFIMYSFADVQGYSKFGSYTGNGNADGTFVYTGFKPAFVITKGSANISSWSMTDSTISTFNDGSLEFFKANEADGESSRSNYDILSNGFKMRTTDADYNGSGNNYIYMAFAENPFVTSTGVPATAR
mgnify:CR=1 FL=1